MYMVRKTFIPLSIELNFWQDILKLGSVFYILPKCKYSFSRFFVAGSEIADQDSLDGQLPSNRHSAAAGHLEASLPPPPKARPASPPSGDGNHDPQSFTKGPASKHKKHRRLNREQVRKM